MSSSSSAGRANALASAALASARSSKARARATMPSSLSILSPEARFDSATASGHRARIQRHGKEKADRAFDEARNEDGENMQTIDERDDGLSSRQRRLSRAARFGAASSSARAIALPEAWDSAVVRLLDETDKATLRRDFVRRQSGASTHSMTPQRLSVLHLTSASPSRYAMAQSALRQVRNRLGRDDEDARLQSRPMRDEWTPSRIVEYGCGAGEGLWAAASVFGDQSLAPLSYEGYDGQGPLLRVAAEIVDAAKINSSTSLQHKGINEAEQDGVLRSLVNMQISFASPRMSAGASQRDKGRATSIEEAGKPQEGNGTLVVCNHSLSAMSSDKARNAFIKSLWHRHPTAEAIVLIEDGTERGFSCIASAREQLLGLGDDHQLDEPRSAECHVVAPCPHDRPCPLLHDYELTDSSTNNSVGRSQRASSPLFHGARIGLGVCASPLRVHVPSYTRLTRNAKRADESVHLSYLVVRRGVRPTFGNQVRQQEVDDAQGALAMLRTLQSQSRKTKEGILDTLRAGSSPKDDVPLAEEIRDEPDNASLASENLGTEEGLNDAEARQELLRLLPNVLQQQAQLNDDGENVPDAMQRAHDVLKRSAELAEEAEAEQEEEQDLRATEALAAASEMLAQQRAAVTSAEQDEETISQVEPGLTQEDIESMRMEAYDWPRLVRPAIKRSGHVIIDACTAQGSIDRFTLSRSMGRQLYQDARKVSHGDLLPYVPLTEEPAWMHANEAEGVKSEAENVIGDEIERSGVEGEELTVQIQHVKSLINCVPSAFTEQRNTMPAHVKVKDTTRGKKSQGKTKGAARYIDWPVSSAMAIGPDLVAASATNTQKDGDKSSTSTSMSTFSQASSFSRRNHYVSGKGRGMEQLQNAKGAYSPRLSRKRSLESYGDDVERGWSTPGPEAANADPDAGIASDGEEDVDLMMQEEQFEDEFRRH